MIHKRHILLLCLIIIAFPQLVMASKTHVVRKSESLHTIARKYHVSVNELKSVNNLTGTKVSKGARLIIPSAAADQSKKVRVAEKAKSYRVVKGDTLPKIAKKTGTKMCDLRRLNGLKGNRIKTGQLLVLNLSIPAVDELPHAQVASNRLQMINKDLLNEQESDDTLAELTDIDADRPVDLAKNLEDNSSSVNKLKKTAYTFLGARYRFGGNSRTALDCSSFIQQVFRDHKVNLPRTAREQFYVGSVVPRGDLKKGDLVFFQTYAHFPSHVGIYLGNRKMIHASSRDRRVVISSMDTPYYLSRFLGARRIGVIASDNFNELLAGVEEERESDVLANDTLGVSLTLNN
ncbi:MAG: C40 family peptidase [Desulfuromonadales bacterium]|nr:C40 family peptidase [Desulfuromonadales bacterium]